MKTPCYRNIIVSYILSKFLRDESNTLLSSSERISRVCRILMSRSFHFLNSLCCPNMCFYVLSSVLWYLLRLLHKNDTSSSSLSPVVCKRVHLLFTLFVIVCALWCPTYIMLCFCLASLRLVYSMLQVSLDCLFLISTFSIL